MKSTLWAVIACVGIVVVAGVFSHARAAICSSPGAAGCAACGQRQQFFWCPKTTNNFSDNANWDSDVESSPSMHTCPTGSNETCCTPPAAGDWIIISNEIGTLIIDGSDRDVHVAAVLDGTYTIDTGTGASAYDLTIGCKLHLKRGDNDPAELTITGEGVVSAEWIWHEGYGKITVSSGATLSTY